MNINFCLVKDWDNENLRNSESRQKESRRNTQKLLFVILATRFSAKFYSLCCPQSEKAPGHLCLRFWS